MAYLLDSDVLVAAKNHHYGFDFCPAFWEWLIASNSAGRVFSIEKVSDEIQEGKDELKEWVLERGSDFFLKPDAVMLPSLSSVSNWITSQSYDPAAISTFLRVADYYLVAHALAHGHTVVTHEVAAPTVKTIKIPNVCIGLKISCINPFEMLRRERAYFILGSRA